MAGRNTERALSFYRRAQEAEDLRQRLLCLYDGFVCLFGPIDACKKAASEASLEKGLLEKVLDGCMYDADSDPYSPEAPEDAAERIPPTEELVASLQEALKRLTSE